MSLIVASEHKGIWGKNLINKILNYAYPELEIIWKNTGNADLLIRSHFYSYEADYKDNNEKIPYITWTGESRNVRLRNYPPLCYIEDTIPKQISENYFYIPYATDRLWNKDYSYPNIRKYTNINERPYFLAYCSSRPFQHREKFFKIIKDLSDTDKSIHGLGRCSNTGHNRPEGGWNKLTEIYKNYRFAITMENTMIPGYVTEKIMNAFIAGAIPIYWGHKETVEKYFNPKAFVNVNNFESLEVAAKYIIDLDNDPVRRNKMASEPVFNNGVIPDIFRLAEDGYVPEYIREIGDYIKNNLKLNK